MKRIMSLRSARQHPPTDLLSPSGASHLYGGELISLNSWSLVPAAVGRAPAYVEAGAANA